jgi:hypothetical protein
MANFELANDAVAYIPIQTLDAEGNPVTPPAGDTFTVASSDPGLTATVGTMPSGPLQGAACAVLTPVVAADANVTVTLTDADNLTAYSIVVDIVSGSPTQDFLDVAGVVLVPQAAPQGATKKA